MCIRDSDYPLLTTPASLPSAFRVTNRVTNRVTAIARCLVRRWPALPAHSVRRPHVWHAFRRRGRALPVDRRHPVAGFGRDAPGIAGPFTLWLWLARVLCIARLR